MKKMKIFAGITKVDEAQRTVFGRAVQEVPDRAGEIFDYAKSKPHFVEWSQEASKVTDGKSVGNVRAMHGKIAAGKLTDIAFHDDERAIDVTAKIVDDNEWAKVLEGVYTGFSIGGSYGNFKEPDAENPSLIRYEAIPAEISLVDLPCVPTATFTVIKAGGASELRKFTAKKSADPSDDDGIDDAKDSGGATDQLAGTDDALDDHASDADGGGKGVDETDGAGKPRKKEQGSGPAVEDADGAKYEAAKSAALVEFERLLSTAKNPTALLDAAKAHAEQQGATAKAEKAGALRKALDDGAGKFTNGQVEALAAEYLPEAERTGTAEELLARLDKVAAPKAEPPAREGPSFDLVRKSATGEETLRFVGTYGIPPAQADYTKRWLGTLHAVSKEEVVKLALSKGFTLKPAGEVAKVKERKDTDPKEGKDKYGDVKFADEKNKKYPIDTAAHIRAAWNYINKPKNSGKYSADDVKSIKAKIVAAWKDKIDADGPPSAEKFLKSLGLDEAALQKAYTTDADGKTWYFSTGLAAVADMAWLVQSLYDRARACRMEQEYEGDEDSELPMRLMALAVEAGEILCEMCEEETQEEGDMGKAITAAVRKLFKLDEWSEEEVKAVEKLWNDTLAGGFADSWLLRKAGARHSKEDMGRLQKIHDHAVDMGAKCAGMSDKAVPVGSLRKALGLAETADGAAVEKAATEAARKAKLWDAAPAQPNGVLRVSKGQDSLPGSSGERELSAEEIELAEKCAKGDPEALMKWTYRYGKEFEPTPTGRNRRGY